jgi:multiple sugar transport system substrate-binding protein
MKTKKILSVIITAMVIATTFAGCGAKAATPSATATTPAKEVVKLVYGRGKDTTAGNKKLVDGFNAKFKGKIEVSYVEMPADTGKQHDAYVTVFNAKGTDYDVIDGDVIWPAEFAQAGYVLPLDNFIAKDGINLKDYMDGPVGSVTFKGKTWGMPKFIDAGLLFYRKDLISTPPATWEDLVKQGTALKGKIQYPYLMQAAQYEGMVCDAVEFIAAYGGQIVDGNGNITISSDGTKKGLEMMKSIVASPLVPSNVTTFQETESANAFILGTGGMIRNWPYQWALAADKTQSKIAGKVGVAPLPKGSVKSAACLGGWITMINKNTKHPNEAWEFVKYMCGAEGQKITAIEDGSSPTLLSVYKDADVIKSNPLFGDANFVAGLSAAVPRPVSPIYPKLSSIMQVEISNYLTGKQDVDTAIKNMDTKMKAAVTDAAK